MKTLVPSPRAALGLTQVRSATRRPRGTERALTPQEVIFLFHRGETEVPVEDREEVLNRLARGE